LRYALEEAIFHHAKVTLLHVLPAHTGTDVYFITGGPGAQPTFEPALERRLGTPAPLQPRVVLHDHYEAALTQLRDLMPASFQGIRMKLSINSCCTFNGFVLLVQALTQSLCCGSSFARRLRRQTFGGGTGPLEKAA
jgi:hypothetical protein